MALTRQNFIPRVSAKVEATLLPLGAHEIRVSYAGRKVALNDEGHIVEGVVRTVAEFLTPSGFRRQMEIPVQISQGQIISPSMGVFEGRTAMLTEDLFRKINSQGSIYGYNPIGQMYSSPYFELDSYKKMRALLEKKPPLRRLNKLY